MSNEEITIFEKVWKMIWDLLYKIIAYFKGDDTNIKNPYAPTDAE